MGKGLNQRKTTELDVLIYVVIAFEIGIIFGLLL